MFTQCGFHVKNVTLSTFRLTMWWAEVECRWGCSPGEPLHQTCQSCCWHLLAKASFRQQNEATCDHKLCGVAHLLLCVDFVIFLTCLQGSLQPVPQLDPGGSCRLDHELEETEQDLFSVKRKWNCQNAMHWLISKNYEMLHCTAL